MGICINRTVFCMYLYVLHIFGSNDTGTAATFPKHLLVGRHLAGCNQGSPGHVRKQLISPSTFHAETRFCTHPRAARPTPLKRPSDSAGKALVPYQCLPFLSHAQSQPILLSGVAPAPWSFCFLASTPPPPTVIGGCVYRYVRVCNGVYLYVCCMYQYVCVVSVCICLVDPLGGDSDDVVERVFVLMVLVMTPRKHVLSS